METCLFINACIGKESRTLRLCRAYLERRVGGQGIAINEINLERAGLAPFNESMLRQRGEDVRSGRLDGPEYKYSRAFAAADFIVIGAPYWDYSFPSLLKVYIEHICVNKITFSYDEEGNQVPLCKAKRLCYITTVGGYVGSHDSGERYLKDMCDMFGIPVFQSYRAEGLDILGCDVEKTLEDVITTMQAE